MYLCKSHGCVTRLYPKNKTKDMAKKATTVQTPIDAHETFVSIRKSFADGADVTIKLKSLYDLQQIDTELDKIYQLRGELPAEVETLENKISELNGKAANVSESITECEKRIAEYRQQYAVCQDQMSKYQAQMDAGVENSREYDSLSKEIENQDLLSQVALKKIGENEEAIARYQQDIEAISEKIAVKKDDLQAKHEELEAIATSTAKQEEKLLAKRAECAEKIDARTMSAYERIRKSVRNHIAVAAVYNGDACGGCHAQIAPQRLIEIAGGKKLIICEYCGRILVNPETAETAE